MSPIMSAARSRRSLQKSRHGTDEMLPKFGQVTDKVTLIRSMSYSPNGLFNHTAAIYQLHTGYTADKVSPSGHLNLLRPRDYPTFGSHIARLKTV